MTIANDEYPIVDNKKIIGPYKVDQFATEADLKMLKVDPSDLDEAFAHQPGTVSYFSNLFGRARAQTLNLKLARDGVEAKVSQALREKALADGEKVVEAKIASQVSKVASYVQACLAYHEAVAVETSLEGMYLAARARKSSLEFFAAQRTSELSAKGYYKSGASD